MVSLEKLRILTPLQKLLKNVRDWGKLIGANVKVNDLRIVPIRFKDNTSKVISTVIEWNSSRKG